MRFSLPAASLSALGLLLAACCLVLVGPASAQPPVGPPIGPPLFPPPGEQPECTPATPPPPVLRPLDNDGGENLCSPVL